MADEQKAPELATDEDVARLTKRKETAIAYLGLNCPEVDVSLHDDIGMFTRLLASVEAARRVKPLLDVLSEGHDQGSPICHSGIDHSLALVSRKWLTRVHEARDAARAAHPEGR